MENKRKSCVAVISLLLLIFMAASCSSIKSDSSDATDTNAIKTNATVINGIDVSEHQENINVNAVDVDFVVVRLGYSGYGTGRCVVDTLFASNVEKFATTDTKVALYWASHAITVDEVKNENQFIIETYNSLSEGAKSKISYIFIDREKIEDPDNSGNYIGRADYLSNKQFNDVLCEQVHMLQESLPNMKVGIYTNPDYLLNIINIDRLGNVPIWIAWWNSTNLESFDPVIERVARRSEKIGTYLEKNIVMWQYSGSGKVSGISRMVDLNLASSLMFE